MTIARVILSTGRLTFPSRFAANMMLWRDRAIPHFLVVAVLDVERRGEAASWRGSVCGASANCVGRNALLICWQESTRPDGLQKSTQIQTCRISYAGCGSEGTVFKMSLVIVIRATGASSACAKESGTRRACGQNSRIFETLSKRG